MNRSIESDLEVPGCAAPGSEEFPPYFAQENAHDGTSFELPATVASDQLQPDTSVLFKKLVFDHRERLYRFVLKNIGNSTDAEDITQHAFMEAARSYATYRGDSSVSTWLYGIAMNLTRNYLSRSPCRKYDFVDEKSLESIASNDIDPAEALAGRQAIMALQSELAGLPDEIREVLLLVALEEVSYEEASIILSIPVGTVRSRISRARAKLKQRLSIAGIELGF